MDFHGNDRNEVIKCWRLHLGSCEILQKVIQSVDSKSGIASIYNKCFLPLKISCRKFRKDQLPPSVGLIFDTIYQLYNMVYYALRPFLGVSALYFDIFKDMTFAYLIYISLYDMSGGDWVSSDYHFEAAIVITLILSIVIVQVSAVLFLTLIALMNGYRSRQYIMNLKNFITFK